MMTLKLQKYNLIFGIIQKYILRDKEKHWDYDFKLLCKYPVEWIAAKNNSLS